MLHTITAIEAQRFDKQRVNLHLNGRFAFSLAAAVVLERGLQPGNKLSDAEVAGLQGADVRQRCYDAALGFLASRPRSEQEVRRRLRQRGFLADPIDDTLGRLRAAGLLDDLAFAEYWRENRDRFNPRGSRLLKAELRQKGVESEVIDEVLDRDDDPDGAYRVALKRARQLAGAERREFFQKVGAVLARRGYDYELARATCDRLWRELHE